MNDEDYNLHDPPPDVVAVPEAAAPEAAAPEIAAPVMEGVRVIEAALATLPLSPGVYRMLDA